MTTIASITEALQSADEEVRLQGLRDLADLPADIGLRLVFEAFGDPSWRVRKQAIDLFLAWPVSRELIGEIIELLHAEENAGLRNAAVEILTRLGRDAVPMLLEQARCPDHDVRKFIIDVLGDIAAPEAVPTLIAGLSDSDSNVRAAAAENLGKLRSAEAVPALLAAMQHQDLLLQFTILDALSRIAAPVPFAELLPYKDEKLLRKALIDCLGKAGDASAVTELVSALTDPMRNVREAAILAVVAIAERHPAAVRQALADCERGPVAAALGAYLEDDSSEALKQAVIRILGWLAAEEAVKPLLCLLDYESLQQPALNALIDIGRANAGILLAMWPQLVGTQRAYLAYILGEAGCHEALPLLRDALQNPDPPLVQMAAHALGCLGDASVLPQLAACLDHADDDVRQATAQALARLGQVDPGQAFAALNPRLAHEDPDQRKLAVTVLRELDDPGVPEALGLALKDSVAAVRREAIRVFERHAVDDHVSALLLALTDEDAEVRRSVVEILASASPEAALEGLQLALRDEDIWVRAAAVRALGRMNAPSSRGLIEQALSDPVGLVSIAALETLADQPGTDCLPQLLAALDHADEEVVNAALNLLTGLGAEAWVEPHATRLIDHPYWAVRAQVARSAVAVLGASARGLLERRQAEETEELVRQQIAELLAELPAE